MSQLQGKIGTALNIYAGWWCGSLHVVHVAISATYAAAVEATSQTFGHAVCERLAAAFENVSGCS